MMHKKNKLFTLRYLLFFLFFTHVPISTMSVESIPHIGDSPASIGLAVGSSFLLCMFCQSFFGSAGTLKDGEYVQDEDLRLFPEIDEPPAQEEPEARSFFSILYKGILIGVSVVVAAGLWNASQNYSTPTAPVGPPSPLMTGPVEGVDLAKYVKMPEDISESFDDLTSLPPSLQTILDDVCNGEKLPGGMLFTGEPGVGKSHSSRALAKKCNAILFRVPGYEFTGQGADFARRLLKLIDRVKKENTKNKEEKPIFLVIDEAEVFGIRSKLGFSAMQLDLGGAIRALMDFTEQKDSGVTCIFTTNHPELIDSALKRPGRVGEHIQFKVPDRNERLSILKLHAKQKNISFTSEALSAIVGQSEGWTGDYLAQCVEKCKRGSATTTIKTKKAKQIAIEVGELWASNQEKREAGRSRWTRFFTSGTSSVASAFFGNPASAVTSGLDAVGSLFEE